MSRSRRASLDFVKNHTVELRESRVLELSALSCGLDDAVKAVEAEGYRWTRVELDHGNGKIRMWVERC